jgi:hypothetical protein
VSNTTPDKIFQAASKIKLGGGVVGKACTVMCVLAITVVGTAWSPLPYWLSGFVIFTVIAAIFYGLWRVMNFADDNPQIATMNGYDIVAHTALQLGTKTNPKLKSDEVKQITEAWPPDIPSQDWPFVMNPDEQTKKVDYPLFEQIEDQDE